jgi:hypothetical protein
MSKLRITQNTLSYNQLNILVEQDEPQGKMVSSLSRIEEPWEKVMAKLAKCNSPNPKFANRDFFVNAKDDFKDSSIKVTDDKKTIDLPRRPYLADASAATVFSGIALGLLTACSGTESANQKQSLELAIREYFNTQNLEVIFFNRAARLARVSFSYATNAYWTIKLDSKEDIDDWLYGNLTINELPKILRKINIHENK